MNERDFVSEKLKVIAQIPVENVPNVPPIQRYLHQSNNTDYILGYAAVALVAVVGFWGLWLKKYFETRLELSIERQKQEFSDAKEDRDRAQNQLHEDRKRSQHQADLFLTTTLETIKEEKENNLIALQKVAHTLEKIDNNQLEMMHSFTEFKGDNQSTSVRVQNIQDTLANIHGITQSYAGENRRKTTDFN